MDNNKGLKTQRRGKMVWMASVTQPGAFLAFFRFNGPLLSLQNLYFQLHRMKSSSILDFILPTRKKKIDTISISSGLLVTDK